MPTKVDPVKITHGVAFRMVLWRWLLVGVLAAQTGCLLFLALLDIVFDHGRGLLTTSFWTFYTTGAAAIVILFVPAMLGYVLIWRVWVGPRTLRAWDIWGRFVTVSWESIHTVKMIHFPLLPTAQLFSTETRRVIWLPLYLTNYRQFAELVARSAGANHPVTREVWRRIEEP